MKKLLFLFALILVSCSSNDDENTEMALNIVNNFSMGEIVLVGWTNADDVEVIIPKGSSRKFVLTNVPNESLLDVNVTMKCLGKSSKTVRVTVFEGQTTTITAQDKADLGPELCCSCFELFSTEN